MPWRLISVRHAGLLCCAEHSTRCQTTLALVLSSQFMANCVFSGFLIKRRSVQGAARSGEPGFRALGLRRKLHVCFHPDTRFIDTRAEITHRYTSVQRLITTKIPPLDPLRTWVSLVLPRSQSSHVPLTFSPKLSPGYRQ